MTTLTELQYKALDHYAHCEMSPANGATPEELNQTGTYLWADEAADALGVSPQAMGGVLTSLANEDLVQVQAGDKDDPDGLFNFTQAGFDAWLVERARRN